MKQIVAYYSQTAVTRTVALAFAHRLGCETVEIRPLNPYTGSYDDTLARALQERADNAMPAIEPLTASLTDYDTIYLCTPIWFDGPAFPMVTLLNGETLAAKTVVPVLTFGSGGVLPTAAWLTFKLPQATVKVPYSVRDKLVTGELDPAYNLDADIAAFLDGTRPKRHYGATLEVGTVEADIFSRACDSYPFPLGHPVAVAQYTDPAGHRYLRYDVVMPLAGGAGEVNGLIYVTVPATGEPYFTEVVKQP